uniref:Protein tweety homolog n=1 Tax=Geotrypetes seraphini TaxID=260995 RepID=A0A6P8SHA1_GEOSA|nr:protein tweety homolog 2 isoform X2 [Geotrypetes seraphini]
MAPARVDYVAPWWIYWLHSLPHLDFALRPVDSTFQPGRTSYQQSLVFLVAVAAICLGVNLFALVVYLLCVCYCKREEAAETKRPRSCCVTWTAVVAGLVCCAAIGIGFYGNSETNDGVYQLTYSLENANHTLAGVDELISATSRKMNVAMEQHLARLNEIFATRGDYVLSLKFMQQMADNIVEQLSGLPVWRNVSMNLGDVISKTSYVEYYRWLSYLLLFILDLVACLIACFALAKHSKCLLIVMLGGALVTLILSWTSLAMDTAAAVGTSDFCIAPDKFIMNQTQNEISGEVIHYYAYCSQSPRNPFQQALTTFQRSLTTMQIQIQGLLQFAVPIFPTAEKDLQGIQQLLNSSETSLHQLTAMLDCRGLHKDYLDAVIGICYDGVEGLLYLALFSLLAVFAFSAMICAMPRAWKHLTSSIRDYDDIDEDDPFNPQARRIAGHNPPRGHFYSGSLGSQSSLPAPAQAVSNAPVSEYMNQAVLFGGNPRYENVPLIGRGSPPPTVCWAPSSTKSILPA